MHPANFPPKKVVSTSFVGQVHMNRVKFVIAKKFVFHKIFNGCKKNSLFKVEKNLRET